jgi:SAM-dependent methyltransferase
MLDIGCGPARILGVLDASIDYTGFDPSESYIDAARRAHGGRGRLFVERVETYEPDEIGAYDIVTAIGVLHHLSDEVAHRLMKIAVASMKPNGRLIALDTGYTKGQPIVARTLAYLDRGGMMRYPEAHVRLAEPYFTGVDMTVRHDRMRVPYTHFILRCTGPKAIASVPTR